MASLGGVQSQLAHMTHMVPVVPTMVSPQMYPGSYFIPTSGTTWSGAVPTQQQPYKSMAQELAERPIPPAELRLRLKLELQKGPSRSRLSIGEACNVHDQLMLIPPLSKKYNLLLPASQLCEYSPFAIHRNARNPQSTCGCNETPCRGAMPLKFVSAFRIGCKPLLHSYSRTRQIASMTPMAALAALAEEEVRSTAEANRMAISNSDERNNVKMTFDTSTEHKFQAVISVAGKGGKLKGEYGFACSEYRLPVQCVSSYCNFPKRASVLCTKSEVGYCFPIPDEGGKTGIYIMDDGVRLDDPAIQDWDRDWDRRTSGCLIGINLRGTYAGLSPGRRYDVGYFVHAQSETETTLPTYQDLPWQITIRRDEWNPQSTAGPGRKAKAREKNESQTLDPPEGKRKKRAPAKKIVLEDLPDRSLLYPQMLNVLKRPSGPAIPAVVPPTQTAVLPGSHGQPNPLTQQLLHHQVQMMSPLSMMSIPLTPSNGSIPLCYPAHPSQMMQQQQIFLQQQQQQQQQQYQQAGMVPNGLFYNQFNPTLAMTTGAYPSYFLPTGTPIPMSSTGTGQNKASAKLSSRNTANNSSAGDSKQGSCAKNCNNCATCTSTSNGNNTKSTNKKSRSTTPPQSPQQQLPTQMMMMNPGMMSNPAMFPLSSVPVPVPAVHTHTHTPHQSQSQSQSQADALILRTQRHYNRQLARITSGSSSSVSTSSGSGTSSGSDNSSPLQPYSGRMTTDESCSGSLVPALPDMLVGSDGIDIKSDVLSELGESKSKIGNNSNHHNDHAQNHSQSQNHNHSQSHSHNSAEGETYVDGDTITTKSEKIQHYEQPHPQVKKEGPTKFSPKITNFGSLYHMYNPAQMIYMTPQYPNGLHPYDWNNYFNNVTNVNNNGNISNNHSDNNGNNRNAQIKSKSSKKGEKRQHAPPPTETSKKEKSCGEKQGNDDDDDDNSHDDEQDDDNGDDDSGSDSSDSDSS